MKRKSIISLLIFCMGLSITTTSCEDMLTPDNERHAYTVAQDTLYSYWGILKSLQNVAERYVILNECRGDMVSGTDFVSDSVQAILSFGMSPYEEMYKDGSCAFLQVRDFYHVINSCNAYIDQCDVVRVTGLNRLYMIKELAQVKAIRAWVYMQLVNIYGEVPFINEPLLTTDAINNFLANPNYPKANADNLYALLASELQEMYAYESNGEYGLPQYESYGDINSSDPNFICHSTKAMFPIAIVLGDLYLMGNKYDEAARWYFTFLNYKYGGPLSVNGYKSTVETRQGFDGAFYMYAAGLSSMSQFTNSPWFEKSALSRESESITAIPSAKGRLDGNVLTDIGRLFGWQPNLVAGNASSSSSSDDDGSKTTSDVALTRNYEHELSESPAYDSLSYSYPYEYFLGRTEGDANTFIKMAVAELMQEGQAEKGVGDARRSWLYNWSGRVYTQSQVGAEAKYGTFVSKQCPGGNFTTVYPMVYRKSMVWLRFAEALNRAGYPATAFAILRDGLCSEAFWYPTERQYQDPDSVRLYWAYKDSTESVVTIPANMLQAPVFSTTDMESIVAAFETVDAMYEEALYAADSLTRLAIESGKYQADTLSTLGYMKTIMPYPVGPVCYYIGRDEAVRFKSNFVMNENYMRGTQEARHYYWKADPSNYNFNSATHSTEGLYYITSGVHARGGGNVELQGLDGSYRYDVQVNKKLAENGETTLSLDELYNKDNQEKVIKAVEELILDEMGLELAFEGTRFFDLSRIARHRGDNSFLAKRVAKRNGTTNAALEQYLYNQKNWYLPLP